ncbi:unnamed protein product [Caenorhabditis brenneri]
MKIQFASIRMYAKLKDFTCIKSLFVKYPRKLDTEYKWFKSLPILEELEFEPYFAYFVYQHGTSLPERIEGGVTYTLVNRTFMGNIQLVKNTWISVTEWQFVNPILNVLVE